jgi:hypothetical protein
MASRKFTLATFLFAPITLAIGCQSPYYADRGAAAGGLLGAGAGALIGSQTGDPLAGAAIGAGLGALGGGVFGSQMDEAAARNRAEIAAHMGRQVAAGAATPDEVVAMTKAGVDPRMIASYVQTSGIARPLAANDIIYLSQQGVATEVIQAMQAPPAAPATVVAGPPVGPPVVVQEHYYGPPVVYGPPHYYHHHHCGPRVGWGVSVYR